MLDSPDTLRVLITRFTRMALCCILYTYTNIHVCIYKYMRNIIKHKNDVNKRTNTLLYKNIISHTLFLKRWCWLCVRDELETRTGYYIDSKFFLILAGLLNRGSLRAASPQSASWFSRFGILSPTDSNRLALVILLFNVHLLPLFFRLFTQVHLLIDGSVEGQYITFKHGLGIPGFKHTLPCLIVAFLATRAKLLELSSYSSLINCTFNFHTKNVFGCYHSLIPVRTRNA